MMRNRFRLFMIIPNIVLRSCMLERFEKPNLSLLNPHQKPMVEYIEIVVSRNLRKANLGLRCSSGSSPPVAGCWWGSAIGWWFLPKRCQTCDPSDQNSRSEASSSCRLSMVFLWNRRRKRQKDAKCGFGRCLLEWRDGNNDLSKLVRFTMF